MAPSDTRESLGIFLQLLQQHRAFFGLQCNIYAPRSWKSQWPQLPLSLLSASETLFTMLRLFPAISILYVQSDFLQVHAQGLR